MLSRICALSLSIHVQLNSWVLFPQVALTVDVFLGFQATQAAECFTKTHFIELQSASASCEIKPCRLPAIENIGLLDSGFGSGEPDY